MSFLQSYQTHPQQYTFQPQPYQPMMQPQPLIQQPQYLVQPQTQLQHQPMLQTYQPDPGSWQPQPPQSQGPTTHPSRTWGGRGQMLRPRGASNMGRGGRRAGKGGRTLAMGYAAPSPVSQQMMTPSQQPSGGYQQPMTMNQQTMVQQQPQQPSQSQQYQQQLRPPYQQVAPQPQQQATYQQQPIRYQQHPVQHNQQQQPVQQPQFMQLQANQTVQYLQQPTQAQYHQPCASDQQIPQQSMQQPQIQQRFVQQPQQAPRVQQFATPGPVQVRPQPATQQYYVPQPQTMRSGLQATFASTPAAAPAVQPIAPVWQARQLSGSPEPPLPGTVQHPPAQQGLDPARQRSFAGPIQAPAPEPEPEPEPEPLNIDWLNPGEDGDPLTSAPTLIEHPARVWNGLLHALDRSIQPIIRWTYELGEGPDPLTTAHLTLILPPTHPALRSHEKFSTLPKSRYDVAYEPALGKLGGVKQWIGQPRLLKLDAQNTAITLAISQNALGWIENPFHRLPTPRETPQLPPAQLQVLRPRTLTDSLQSTAIQQINGQPDASKHVAQDLAFVNERNQPSQWQGQQHEQPQMQQQTSHVPMPPQPASQPPTTTSVPTPAAALSDSAQQSTPAPTPYSSPLNHDLIRIEWGGGPANGGGEAWVPVASLGGLQAQTSVMPQAQQLATTGKDTPTISQAMDSTNHPLRAPAPGSSQGSSTSIVVPSIPSIVQPGPVIQGSSLSASTPAPLSPVSAAVRAMAERTNVDLIESTCISMGKGGIESDWKGTSIEATGLYGCELNINICPSVTRYFATAEKHATPELAQEDCATIAIRKDALDFISKYSKYAVPKSKVVAEEVEAPLAAPKTPPLVFSGGRFTAPPPKTDVVQPAVPQPGPLAMSVVEARPQLPAAPPGQTHLDLLLEALRVSVDPAVQGEALNFDPIIETNGKHGCKLLVSVREQENIYLEDSIWASMDEAREAVCARALGLNVQGWMAWAESTFVPVAPVAQPQAVASTSALTGIDACTVIYTELAHHGLVPEVKYDKNQFTKLYQAQLLIPLPGRDGVVFCVPFQYSHKTEARDAVAQLAVEQGILDSIRSGAPLQQPAVPPQQPFQQAPSDSDDTVSVSDPSTPLEVTELELVPLPQPSRGKKFGKGKRKGKNKNVNLSGEPISPADDVWGKKRKSSDAEWVNKLTAVCFQQDLPAPTFETIQAAVLNEFDEPLFRVAVTVGLQRFFAPEPLPEIEAAKEEICRKAYEQLTRSKRLRQ